MREGGGEGGGRGGRGTLSPPVHSASVAESEE